MLKMSKNKLGTGGLQGRRPVLDYRRCLRFGRPAFRMPLVSKQKWPDACGERACRNVQPDGLRRSNYLGDETRNAFRTHVMKVKVPQRNGRLLEGSCMGGWRIGVQVSGTSIHI